jgi:hypothetical protein
LELLPPLPPLVSELLVMHTDTPESAVNSNLPYKLSSIVFVTWLISIASVVFNWNPDPGLGLVLQSFILVAGVSVLLNLFLLAGWEINAR